jgi:hypothetical protein
MKNPMPERDRELLAAGLVFNHLVEMMMLLHHRDRVFREVAPSRIIVSTDPADATAPQPTPRGCALAGSSLPLPLALH